MHPNPIFRKTAHAASLALVRSRAFGTLTINADPAPLMAHVPLLLSDDAAYADLHLVRSNPIARALPATARLAVLGPDSYISPDWYETHDQVPTWNYVAVHLIGRVERLPDDHLHPLLDAQSKHFEDQLAPKKPWHSSKMSDGVMDRMMRAIVPVRLHIEDIDSTWKLNQNKDDAVRLRAANAVATHGLGTDLAALSDLMRQPPPAEDT